MLSLCFYGTGFIQWDYFGVSVIAAKAGNIYLFLFYGANVDARCRTESGRLQVKGLTRSLLRHIHRKTTVYAVPGNVVFIVL